MGKQRPRLTAQIIRDLPAPSRGSKIHYDGGPDRIHGFGICVGVSGHKAFILNYRFARSEHRLTIGAVANWSLAAARVEAAGLRRMIDMGQNPLIDSSPSGAVTMADLIGRFEREELPRRRPATGKSYRSIIKTVLPVLGHLPVASVTSADIEALHRRLSIETPIMANRVGTFLFGLFRLAIKWGLREGNPVVGIERNREEPRTRYLTGAELDRLLSALDGLADRQAGAIFRVLLLTGARKSEVCQATWIQFDLIAGVWTKPAAAVKQRRDHRAPLSKAVVDLLQAIPRAGPFVFPAGKDGAPRIELRAAWREVCRVAGLENLHIHDLRHSFASFAIQSGASLEIIGGLLGHSSPGTTSRYAHLDDATLRAAAERVGAIVRKS